MLTEGDKVDPDLMNISADDAIRRTWDIQDSAARAVVTRRSKEQTTRALQESKRRMHFEDEIDPGTWVMVWRKLDMAPGDYVGPGLLVANTKKRERVTLTCVASSGNAHANNAAGLLMKNSSR